VVYAEEPKQNLEGISYKGKVYTIVMPKVDNEELQKALNDPAMIVYDETVLRRAYEFNGVFHDAYYNISAGQPREPFGNGNREYPWATTAGTDTCDNIKVVKLLSLPRKDNGDLKKIVTHPGTNTVNGWTYPHGTFLCEVLCMERDGQLQPFEIRVRKREESRFIPEIYRPCRTANELAVLAEKMNYPEVVAFCKNEKTLEAVNYKDVQHGIFDQDGNIDVLPDLPKPLVDHILTKMSFKPSLGYEWKGDCACPTVATNTSGFYPAGYAAHNLRGDSCIKCHSTAGQSVDNFNRGVFRDWYGHIRGSDHTFSFHPIDNNTVSGNGVNQRFGYQWLAYIEQFDANVHTPADYSQITESVNE
jgi:hypothetical protein